MLTLGSALLGRQLLGWRLLAAGPAAECRGDGCRCTGELRGLKFAGWACTRPLLLLVRIPAARSAHVASTHPTLTTKANPTSAHNLSCCGCRLSCRRNVIEATAKKLQGTPAEGLSRADLIALAGAHAVRITGGPQIKVRSRRGFLADATCVWLCISCWFVACLPLLVLGSVCQHWYILLCSFHT